MTPFLAERSKAEKAVAKESFDGFFRAKDNDFEAVLRVLEFEAAFRLSARCFRIAPTVSGINIRIISHVRQLLKNGSSLLFRPQTSILSAAFIIMVTYGLSHLMGLLKTRLLISYFFGANAYVLDVYYAAFVVPDTLFQLLVLGSISAAFIPVFTRYLEKKQDKQAWHIARASLTLTLVVFLCLCLLLFIFAWPISKILAPGFTPVQMASLVQITRLLTVAQIFFCISGFLSAIIQSHNRFLAPALAPIIYNIGIIAGIIFLSPTMGIMGPAIGAVLGALLHMAVQMPVAIKLGFKPLPLFDRQHPGVKEILRLIPPRSLALGVDQIEQLVAVGLASTLFPGSLSILNVARMLYTIPSSLFGVTIGQAALPTLARQSNANDKIGFIHTLIGALRQIIFLALPLSVLFIVLRIPIVRIVFGAKSFPWSATLLTGKTAAILILSSASVAVSQLIARGFYALHDTSTPLSVGLVAAIINSAMSFIFVKIFGWGVIGLAVSISLTSLIETFILFLFLSKKVSRQTSHNLSLDRELTIPIAKMLIVSIVTGLSLWLPMRLLDQFVFDTTRTVPLVILTSITSIIGIVVYGIFSYLFHVSELNVVFTLISKLGNIRNLIKSNPAPVLVTSPDES